MNFEFGFAIDLVIFAANLGLFLTVWWLTNDLRFGRLAKSMVNPVFLLGTFQLINAILFLRYSGQGFIAHPRAEFQVTQAQWTYCHLLFLLFNFCLTVGLVAGSKVKFEVSAANAFWQRIAGLVSCRTAQTDRLAAQTLLALVLMATFATLIVVFNVRSPSDVLTLTATRFHAYRQFSLILYMFALVRAFYILYCASLPKFSSSLALLTLAVSLVMVASGVRMNMFCVVLCLAMMVHRGVLPINRMWVFVSLPLTGLASMLIRFYSRAYTYKDSLRDLVQSAGGWIEVIVNPLEFHCYSTMTAVEAMNMRAHISRIPGESLWAALTLPIPRDLMPFKGRSASSDFSELIAPEVWDALSSQATIGVFGVAQLEYGPLLGCLFVFLTGIVFVQLCLFCCNIEKLEGFACCVTLVLAAVMYTRSGVTQIAQLFWSFVIALACHYVLSMIMAVISSPQRNLLVGGVGLRRVNRA